jgi:peptidyl-tRNA hydrolase, PTH2 family
MYIFVNRGLKMSPGKLAAQVAHAAIEAYKLSESRGNEPGKCLVRQWYEQGTTKIVMLAEDTEQLLMIERYLKERGYNLHLVIDEGRTEIKSFTPTALGVELVDKDDPKVAEHFGHFKTYREEKPAPVSDQKFWTGVRRRVNRAS